MQIKFLKSPPIEVVQGDGFAPIVKIVSEKFQYVPNVISDKCQFYIDREVASFKPNSNNDIFFKFSVEIEQTPLEIDENIEPIPDIFSGSEPSDTVPVLLSPGSFFGYEKHSPNLEAVKKGLGLN